MRASGARAGFYQQELTSKTGCLFESFLCARAFYSAETDALTVAEDESRTLAAGVAARRKLGFRSHALRGPYLVHQVLFLALVSTR